MAIGCSVERHEIRRIVKQIGENTTDADFIIPDNMRDGGKIAWGNCIFGEGLDGWFKLHQRLGFLK